jgi:hypothetical protein
MQVIDFGVIWLRVIKKRLKLFKSLIDKEILNFLIICGEVKMLRLSDFLVAYPRPTPLNQDWLDRFWNINKNEGIRPPEISKFTPDGKERPEFDPEIWDSDEWIDFCDFPYYAIVDADNSGYILYSADSLEHMILNVFNCILKLIKENKNVLVARIISNYPDMDHILFSIDNGVVSLKEMEVSN